MTRLPMLVPCCCLWLWTLFWSADHMPPSIALWVTVGGAVVSVLACVRGRHAVALHLACCAAGASGGVEIRRSVVPAPSDVGVMDRARVSGVVSDVRTYEDGRQRFVVTGEIDAQHLPCMEGRVLVSRYRPDSSQVPVRGGERRILFGHLRRPDPATLPGETPEGSLTSAFGASFILERVGTVLCAEQPWPDRLRDEIVAAAHAVLERTCAPDVQATAMAILLGDRDALTSDAVEAYRKSGTYHMFSVSGSHVALLMAALAVLVGTAASWWRCGVILLVTFMYVWLTGADPPAVRAALMGGLFLVGRVIERSSPPVNTLSVVTVLMIAVRPELVHDLGMILSVAAVASILVITPWWVDAIERIVLRPATIMRVTVRSLGVSVAATIGTLPMAVVAFGTIPAASPLSNVVVVPLLSAGLLCCVGLFVAAPLGLAEPLAWCLSLCIRAADAAAHAGAVTAVSSTDPWWLGIVSVIVTLGWLWPLVSPTITGAVVRWCVAHIVLAAMVTTGTEQPHAPIVAERRSGTILASVRHDTLVCLFVGAGNGPLDTRALMWTRQWTGTIRSGGIGIWGRRMSGRVRIINRENHHDQHQGIP